MKINSENILDSLLEGILDIDYIREEDIPNIDLYMDQVTTFMDEQLSSTKRYESDKILTKTMINNYAKNNLLPSPKKKKYSKEHILVLTFIYYFKNILSIKDIENLLRPLTEKYFHQTNSVSLTDIYNSICEMELAELTPLGEELKHLYSKSEETFSDAPEDEQQYLRLFSFICGLSFDVYVKKFIIEKMIDELIAKPSTEKDSISK